MYGYFLASFIGGGEFGKFLFHHLVTLPAMKEEDAKASLSSSLSFDGEEIENLQTAFAHVGEKSGFNIFSKKLAIPGLFLFIFVFPIQLIGSD